MNRYFNFLPDLFIDIRDSPVEIFFKVENRLSGYPQFSSKPVGKQGTDDRRSHLSIGDWL
jgi:hypothetical protein